MTATASVEASICVPIRFQTGGMQVDAHRKSVDTRLAGPRRGKERESYLQGQESIV